MPRSLNTLVAGGMTRDNATLARPPADAIAFARRLAGEIIDRGHSLLTGCRTELDTEIARSGSERLAATPEKDVSRRIVSYVRQGTGTSEHDPDRAGRLGAWREGSHASRDHSRRGCGGPHRLFQRDVPGGRQRTLPF